MIKSTKLFSTSNSVPSTVSRGQFCAEIEGFDFGALMLGSFPDPEIGFLNLFLATNNTPQMEFHKQVNISESSSF